MVVNNDSNSAKGSLAATAVALTAPSVIQTPIGLFGLKNMAKISRELPADSVEIVNKAADQVLKNTKLAEKGVSIIDGKNIFFTATGDRIKALFGNSKIGTRIAELCDMNFAIKNGKNACFDFIQNKVFVNREKMSLASFHELGHAFNRNNSKFWKAMQNLRTPMTILPIFIALYGAFSKNSKPKEEGGELTTKQKINNFIRNNAGKLAFAATLPIVAEETMASIRGCKWAKQLLNKDLAQKVLKTNIWGGITYLAVSAAFGLGARLAVKTKDHFQNKNS